MKLEFSRYIVEKSLNIRLIKIRPVGVEVFRADGRTNRRKDMTKLIVAFRSFANVPKIIP
jgi:hypothetical protein